MGVAGADFWCEATCGDRSCGCSNAPMAAINVIKTLTQSIPKEKSMSKVSIAAAAALVIASVAPVGAYAQSYGAFAQGYGGAYSMPEHQSRTQSKHLKPRVPANARASATESGGFPMPAVNSRGRWFETDPDPGIRFEMNRDDRDRRSGG
jgi:hypothetical protein